MILLVILELNFVTIVAKVNPISSEDVNDILLLRKGCLFHLVYKKNMVSIFFNIWVNIKVLHFLRVVYKSTQNSSPKFC